MTDYRGPEEREDKRLEYMKEEYQDDGIETPVRYEVVSAKWATHMICEICGYEYWDCMCEEETEKPGRAGLSHTPKAIRHNLTDHE